MPLPKRFIEPFHVSRSVYQQDGLQSIELETVTNTTLTNIIRQLSSLSKHAEDVFCELARDVENIGDRANSLQARIDRLAIKVTQLDSNIEDVPLTDITRKKAFKSAKQFDQQIFSRATMSAPMLETYSQCDKPPPLDKLNVYREDGKDGLKFYTDPNYFFELWSQEMLKDTERVMHDRGRKIHKPRQDATNGYGGIGGRVTKKRVRTPHNTREKQRQLVLGHGETLMPNSVTNTSSISNKEPGYGSVGVYETLHSRPNSIELNQCLQMEKIENDIYGPILSQTIPASNVGIISGQHILTYTNVNGINSMTQIQASHHLSVQQQQLYDDVILNPSHSFYVQTGQNAISPEGIYSSSNASRAKPRPSQPPPAPPSNGSNESTPNVSSANTPTRSRSMSASRDTLPPPPPIPEDEITSSSQILTTMNNNNSHVAKLLTHKNSPSRMGSSPPFQNNAQDLNVLSDLLSSPAIPNQTSPPNIAPPPPPPPPPLNDDKGKFLHIVSKAVINREIQANGIILGGSNQHNICTKKLLPPFHDTRTDLMKAIRDGITLRKVEKSEQKEIERNTALLDVASILARRVAIELSESEDSDSDDDSEGWIEHNDALA